MTAQMTAQIVCKKAGDAGQDQLPHPPAQTGVRKKTPAVHDKSRYGNLAHWSPADWQNLDIHLYIAANFNRYCGLLLKKVGPQYLPSDATDSLLGLYCDVAWKPLKAVHSRHLDAEGERRNQVMLGTLKMITLTRMVEALIREYPNHLDIDQIPGLADLDDQPDDGDESLSHLPVANGLPQPALFAAAHSPLPDMAIWQEDQIEDERTLIMLEKLRSRLTPIQFRHLRHIICEHLDVSEIAELTGYSVTNARTVLLSARRRMIELVAPELVPSVADCVLRK